ncbi:Tetratricopeptide repeat-containing protein [Jannaschia pohangensis]|uniref:Tetratricopeptide repeat-containing protein n=2 Tax=Jannaschia pohangensis TaxID=390807 RepID=A0A1I3TTG6_9RHOB|nr:Tetratricopeptide repeat-containing protein [Jannaschia pohangensis]
MTISGTLRGTAAALAVALILSGCKSEGDRMVKYVSSGESYAAQGDYPRALIQYRNALKIDPDHAATRAAIGHILLDQGALGEARQEFTLLAERFPNDLEFRSKLGEIALVRADWPALERQADAASLIDGDALDSRALSIASRYHDATRERAATLQARLADEATELLVDAPAHPVLLRVAIDHRTRSDDPMSAVPLLDAALDADPHWPELQILRIRLLSDANQTDAAEARLFELARLYPDDPQIAGLLVARHMSRGKLDEAEDVLRALADGAPRGQVQMRMVLVQFLNRTRGPDRALAELDRLVKDAGDGPAGLVYSAMDYSIRFDQGDRDTAVDGLTALLAKAGEQPEARRIRVMLARMHDRLGDRARARAELNAVLSVDPGDADALKLRALWAIDEEAPKTAIVDLRTALAQRPRDSELMTLLAAAHAQEGQRGLAMEQLAAAAQTSGHAARETERYATALMTEGRNTVAQRVLEVAFEAAPGDLGIQAMLADIYLDKGDWADANRVISHMRRIDSDAARAAIAPLEAALLLGQGRGAEADGALSTMLQGDLGRQQAFGRLIAGLVRRGDADLARQQLDAALGRHPGDRALRILDADLRLTENDVSGAEAIYRDMLETDDTDEAYTKLFAVLRSQGKLDEADTLLAEALARHPASRALRLIESNRLDVVGDTAGAIALLETLHAEDTRDPLAANNLAALLSAGTPTPEVLERAARITAHLRGTSNPAMSDTIGWIAYLRGDVNGALPLMQRAARGLPRDPQVQLRLARVLEATGAIDEAREAYDAVLTLTAEDHPLAQDARARRAALGG